MSPDTQATNSSTGNWDAFVFVQALAAEASTGRIQLPCFPDVAVRMRRVLADENCDTGQVARVAGAEPALAAKLLRMANSVALNPGGLKVTELKSAIARLGFSNVRSASLAYAVEQVRNAPALEPMRNVLNELWERSVLVASLAYVAARKWTYVSPDQALLAGLMHGMGRMYIITRSVDHPGLFADAATFQRMLRDWHAPVAKMVLESWEIAPEIVSAVEHFEQLDRRNAGDADLTDVLTIADLLASYHGDALALEVQLAEAAASGRLGITQESVALVLQESADELASLNAALGA
jgi:HD-like signal output (HDOD) protein